MIYTQVVSIREYADNVEAQGVELWAAGGEVLGGQ